MAFDSAMRSFSDPCCDYWTPETDRINGPILLAQARNPHLTRTPAFAFKEWTYCPWCGSSRRVAADAEEANYPATIASVLSPSGRYKGEKGGRL